jgi:hypothetical protein
MTTARGPAFTTAVRVIDRVLGDAAGQRAMPFQRVRPALPKFWFWLSGFETAPTVPMQSPRR